VSSAVDDADPAGPMVVATAIWRPSARYSSFGAAIYVSESTAEGFGPASAVDSLNSPGNDIQPNVRKDGLEVVFSSSNGYPGHQGGQDVYVSTRVAFADAWSAPVNLGTAVNTAASETRPSLSLGRGDALLRSTSVVRLDRKACPMSRSRRGPSWADRSGDPG
jgi:hypothetical protein